jgi:hypothetical protein
MCARCSPAGSFVLRQGRLPERRLENAEWNRGAYLVNGLAIAAHTHAARLLGAEKKGSHLTGGEAEAWTAFALDAGSPAPVSWTHDSLFAYLRQAACRP